MIPFVTLSETELLERLKSIELQMADGARTVSTGVGDVSRTKQIVNSLEETWRRIYSALNALNPDAYPLTNGMMSVTSTRVVFGSGGNQWSSSNG